MGRRRVLVVGDVGVDRYTVGDVERISPEAPVPIVLVREEKLKLGLAANVADNIQVLGGVPLLLGVVGKDRTAQDFKALLRQQRIAPAHLLEDPSRRTVLKERIVSDRQQLLRIDYESAHAASDAVRRKLVASVRRLVASGLDAVVIEDYAKGLLGEETIREIVAIARKKGKLVAIDPNLKTPIAHYRGASVLTPNTHEAEALSGIKIADQATLERAGRALLKATGAEHVVITLGKEGMAIFSKGQPIIRQIATYAREVYDVSGAGDTVISVLALALCSGAEIEEACVLGNLAAGVEVGKRGTATVTVAEIRGALDYFRPSP
jgi:rfaE bifunctional protein kinase chain/domain